MILLIAIKIIVTWSSERLLKSIETVTGRSRQDCDRNKGSNSFNLARNRGVLISPQFFPQQLLREKIIFLLLLIIFPDFWFFNIPWFSEKNCEPHATFWSHLMRFACYCMTSEIYSPFVLPFRLSKFQWTVVLFSSLFHWLGFKHHFQCP